MYFSDYLGPNYRRHAANDGCGGYCDEGGQPEEFVPQFEEIAFSFPSLSQPQPAHIRHPTLHHTFGHPSAAAAYPRRVNRPYSYAPSSGSYNPPDASSFIPCYEHVPAHFIPSTSHRFRESRPQVLPHSYHPSQPFVTDQEEEEDGDIVYLWDKSSGQPRAMRLTPMHGSPKVYPTTAQRHTRPAAVAPQGACAELVVPKSLDFNASQPSHRSRQMSERSGASSPPHPQTTNGASKEQLLKQQELQELQDKVLRMIEEAMSAQKHGKPTLINLGNNAARSRSPSPPPPAISGDEQRLAKIIKTSPSQTERGAMQTTSTKPADGSNKSSQDVKRTIPVRVISTAEDKGVSLKLAPNVPNAAAAATSASPAHTPAPAAVSVSVATKKQLSLTRSQAARVVQKWWRGWRVWGLQRDVMKGLRHAAAMLKKASTVWEENLAGESTLTQKQYMEVSDLATKVVMQLDSLTCSSNELRAIKKRLTNNALALEDRVQSLYLKPSSPRASDHPEPSPLSGASTPTEGSSSSSGCNSSNVDIGRQVLHIHGDEAEGGENEKTEVAGVRKEVTTELMHQDATCIAKVAVQHSQLEEEISFKQLEDELTHLDVAPVQQQACPVTTLMPGNSCNQYEHSQATKDIEEDNQSPAVISQSQVPVDVASSSTQVNATTPEAESLIGAVLNDHDQNSASFKEDCRIRREPRVRIRLSIEDADES
ncbi:hypothetical protein CEUSTIGMA_g13054.t1 [Chlamydomonas eustigma]|uniref:BAG domain-containing protein n=1 Tax=Chlamydomonas eustigma TaxID=1157962 RepID=A0A250XRR9_9CHLO|nr:hypothetical protein CEUSTIGMA_g13054.t1 [Chlamydomonas eustigma]|eukprot:GAX85639.1 hypothetical protein CEUSTIGMA_g13054.t1 [Chlamydomonas eustigma]